MNRAVGDLGFGASALHSLGGLGRILAADDAWVQRCSQDITGSVIDGHLLWHWHARASAKPSDVAEREVTQLPSAAFDPLAPKVIRREQAEPLVREGLDQLGAETLLAVPIRLEGRTWGYLCASKRTERPKWRAEAVELASLAAATLGTIVENHQLRFKIEEMSRAKSDFLSMVSHELRTPMNAVIGFADLMEGTDLDEEQNEFLRGINRGSQAMMRIIEDLIEFTRDRSGAPAVRNDYVNTRDLLRQAIAAFRTVAAEKGLSLVSEIAPDLPGQIITDPARLRQLLKHLMSNAVRFTTSGEVRLSSDAYRLYDEDTDVILRISVIDTGPGIPEDLRQVIFQPFEKRTPDGVSAGASAGLGLAIAKQMVDALGGTIHCDSELGQGTTFTAYLPVRVIDTGSEDAAAMTSQGRAPVSLRILTAVKHADTRATLAGLVERLGHQPIAVRSSAEAEATVKSETEGIDLALIDLEIERSDKNRLFELIGAQGGEAGLAAQRIPVIGLDGGEASSGWESRGERMVDDCLSKPFTISRLCEIIERTLAVGPGGVKG